MFENFNQYKPNPETMQKVISIGVPLLGAAVAITLFQPAVPAAIAASAGIKTITFGGVVKTLAIGAGGYAVVKVLISPEAEKTIEAVVQKTSDMIREDAQKSMDMMREEMSKYFASKEAKTKA